MFLYSGTTQEHYCFHDRISLYEHSSNLTLKWDMFQLPALVSLGWIKTRWFIDTSIWLRGKLRNILLDLNIRVVSCVGPDVDPAPRPRLLAARQQLWLADIEPPWSRHHRGRHAAAGGEQLGDPDNAVLANVLASSNNHWENVNKVTCQLLQLSRLCFVACSQFSIDNKEEKSKTFNSGKLLYVKSIVLLQK